MGFNRAEALSRLAGEPFDVLVVGGGITGAGVALDAASRGLRTALVERHDFASGTSSKSSKLVHGGLRYLQQREYRLVYEGLAERQRLLRTAPHLVHLLPFLMPMLSRGGLVHPRLVRGLSTILWLYDLTGGARIGRLHDRVGSEEVLARMPTLRPDRVVGGFVYYDARTDDARLTLAVARTAADQGAALANWCPVVSLTKDAGGRVTGADVHPAGHPAAFPVRASVVVSATGVWSDVLGTMDDEHHPDTLRPAKGIHISVPWAKVRNEVAVVLPVPEDRRSVFVVPYGDVTYVGTTDTDYDGPVDDPQCTPADVDYLLAALNVSLTDPVTRDDVVGTWAGLRPLLRSAGRPRTTDLSRRHRIAVSESGVVSVTGGKLTTYRSMAADAVDEVVRALGRGGRSRTRRLRLHGAAGYHALLADSEAPARLGVDPALLAHLADRHGADARVVAAMVARDPELGRPLVPSLPYVAGEAVHAVRYEMARTLDDVLSRRIPARWLARDASAAAAEQVARLVAPDLGWTEADIVREVSAYRASVEAEREAGGLGTVPDGLVAALPIAGR